MYTKLVETYRHTTSIWYLLQPSEFWRVEKERQEMCTKSLARSDPQIVLPSHTLEQSKHNPERKKKAEIL